MRDDPPDPVEPPRAEDEEAPARTAGPRDEVEPPRASRADEPRAGRRPGAPPAGTRSLVAARARAERPSRADRRSIGAEDRTARALLALRRAQGRAAEGVGPSGPPAGAAGAGPPGGTSPPGGDRPPAGPRGPLRGRPRAARFGDDAPANDAATASRRRDPRARGRSAGPGPRGERPGPDDE